MKSRILVKLVVLAAFLVGARSGRSQGAMAEGQPGGAIKPSASVREYILDLSKEIEAEYFKPRIQEGLIKSPTSNRRNFRIECCSSGDLQIIVCSLPRSKFIEFFEYIWGKLLVSEMRRVEIMFYADETIERLPNSISEFKGVDLEARMSASKGK